MLLAYERHPSAFTSTVAEREGLPLSWWSERLGPGDDAQAAVFGAFDGAELVGAAGLRPEPRIRERHKALLFGMSVADHCCRRGIGRALVGSVLAHARAVPWLRIVQLTVSEGNAAALALYRRCGFVVHGVEPYAIGLGDRYVTKIHMWHDLRSAGNATAARSDDAVR